MRAALLGPIAAQLLSEVANRGSPGVCGGEDWVELAGEPGASLAGVTLCDDARCVALSGAIPASGYAVLCRGALGFGVASNETLLLHRADGTVDAATPGHGRFGWAWARGAAGFALARPTPGRANAQPGGFRASLAEQHAQGAAFFGAPFDARYRPCLFKPTRLRASPGETDAIEGFAQ